MKKLMQPWAQRKEKKLLASAEKEVHVCDTGSAGWEAVTSKEKKSFPAGKEELKSAFRKGGEKTSLE